MIYIHTYMCVVIFKRTIFLEQKVTEREVFSDDTDWYTLMENCVISYLF